MVSLWGSKKKNDDGQDGDSDTVHSENTRGGDSRSPAPPRRSGDSVNDPDERTRLLQQHQVPGYLSPDDPAVCSLPFT